MNQWLACLLAAGITSGNAAAPDAGGFPRLPPTEPAEAFATFDLDPAFRLELVASEPLIADPVALSFDENGALYVVEMRDYSERREEKLGRVSRLEDRDGDGRMDHVTRFAEGLPWPTGVLCYGGGVFVVAAPDLWYFKDTDGDGIADERRVVLTGFGDLAIESIFNRGYNVQQLPNSLRWGPDQRIHIAEGGNGSRIRRPDEPRDEGLQLQRRDLSFDPRTIDLRTVNGGGQFGMTFDDFGRKFVCSNSQHLQWVPYERIAAPLYQERMRSVADGTQLHPPAALVDIAADGGAAAVFRRSPDEAWRVVRTQWRVAGTVGGPIEGGGRPSGYFTGATGIQIYRGDLFGGGFQGNVLVADIGSNLIHRKRLRPVDGSLAGERLPTESNREFLASTDNWFRPTQLENGPDGALYVLDLYREVVEHPWSLPPGIKEHLDLNHGNDRGRIWRIVPKEAAPRRQVRLGGLTTAELVALLENPNGWHRDTASRLLVERGGATAVAPLEELVRKSPVPVAQVHALEVLRALNHLALEVLREALNAASPDVRERAIKIAGDQLPRPELFDESWLPVWLRLAGDEAGQVRRQLMFSLAGHPSRELYLTLLRHARLRGRFDVQLSYFAFGWLPEFHPDQFDPTFYERYPGQARDLIRKAAALADSQRITSWVDARTLLEPADRTELNFKLLTAIAALQPSPFIDSNWQLPEKVSQEAIRQARLALTMSGLRWLGVGALLGVPGAEAEETLIALLPATDDLDLQSQLTQHLPRRVSEPGFDRLLELLPQFSPTVQSQLLAASFQSERLRPWLLDRLERDPGLRQQAGAGFRTMLRNSREESVREWATRVYGPPAASATHAEKRTRFAPALEISGDAERGRSIYLERCAACHRAGGPGAELGPNLVNVSRSGRPVLLDHVLDPNREMTAGFEAWEIVLKNGDEWSGRIAGHDGGGNGIVLSLADGSRMTLSQSEIATTRPSAKSLMPEGLEEGMTTEQMADLLTFIESLAAR